MSKNFFICVEGTHLVHSRSKSLKWITEQTFKITVFWADVRLENLSFYQNYLKARRASSVQSSADVTHTESSLVIYSKRETLTLFKLIMSTCSL